MNRMPRLRLKVSPLVSPWLLAVVMLVTAAADQMPAVHAQGSGAGRVLQVQLALSVDTWGLHLDRLCLGQTVSLPIAVQATVEVSGTGPVGRMQARGATFITVAQNPGVVEAHTVVSPSISIQVPFSARLDLTGLSVGSSTVRIDATVHADIFRSLDDNVGLPIPDASQPAPVDVQVRVVPCEYRVSGTSFWSTNIFSASMLVSVTFRNVVLKSTTGGIFRGEYPSFFELSVTSNRLPTCDPWTNEFTRQPLDISGEIVDDELILRIAYPLPYEREELGCSGSLTITEYRRRGEFSIQPGNNYQNFEPATLDISVPLDGGSVNKDHRLTFKNGEATGRYNITITPIESR